MDGFGKWVEHVKQEAEKRGRVFVLECFEGNERDDARFSDGMEVQDLSGFLLTADQAEAHAEATKQGAARLHEIPDIDFVFVGWAMDGNTLAVTFQLAQPFAPPVRMVL